MKIKQRALALLLSLAMVLTFMPALAFANDIGDIPDESKISEIQEDTLVDVHVTEADPVATFKFVPAKSGYYAFESYGSANTEGAFLREDGTGRKSEYIDYYRELENFRAILYVNAGDTYYLQAKEWLLGKADFKVKVYEIGWDAYEESHGLYQYFGGAAVELKVGTVGDNSGLTYTWYLGDKKLDDTNKSTYKTTKGGLHHCVVSDGKVEQWIYFPVELETVEKNNLMFIFDPYNYGRGDQDSVKVSADYGSEGCRIKGAVTIPATVTFCDDVEREVAEIRRFENATEMTSISIPPTIKIIQGDAFVNTGLKSITIPPSVTEIGWKAIGFNASGKDEDGDYTNYTLVNGFIIYGKTGSAAEDYAKMQGITFIDPDAPTPTPAPTGGDKIKNGSKVTVSTGTYKVVSVNKKTAAFAKAKNKKAVTVPATVKLGGKTYKVTTVNASAFKGSAIRTVTIGKNVKKIYKNAFKGSKTKKIILKTKLLKKSGVKGSLAGSRVTTVQVSVGSKAVNKKYVRTYKKIFTKANAGRKVTVR